MVASQLALTTAPSSTAQSGVALVQQPAVQLRDAANNAVSQAGVVVTATIASGGGTLGGTTSATTNASGTATFTDLAVTGSGAQVLRFSAPGLSAVSSGTIIVAASSGGSATQLALTTAASSTAQSGIAFAQQPVVQLRDAANNAVSQSGVVVTASIASGGGTLGGTTSVATNASGTAAFTNLALSGTVGSRTLRFSAGTLTPAVSSAITLTAGPATQLTLTTAPSSTAQSGVALAQQPVVQLRDAASNPVSQAGITVTAAVASGGATLSGTAAVATTSTGAATFTNLALTGSSGAQTLQFTAPGLTPVTSGTITLSTSSGGGSASAPDIYPNDGSYGWVFNGADATVRSGTFTGSDLATPFLLGTSSWIWAAGEGPAGINAMKLNYPVSTQNVGATFYYTYPARRKTVYTRFFYKQSNPFNSDGTTSNQDWVKLIRVFDQTFNLLHTPSVAPGGVQAGGWDPWDMIAYSNSYNYNNTLGHWNCYEVLTDLSVPGQAHQTIWVNDTTVLDQTLTSSQIASTLSLGYTQFLGVVNSMASASTAWITMIGVSSHRMGCPPGFSFPD